MDPAGHTTAANYLREAVTTLMVRAPDLSREVSISPELPFAFWGLGHLTSNHPPDWRWRLQNLLQSLSQMIPILVTWRCADYDCTDCRCTEPIAGVLIAIVLIADVLNHLQVYWFLDCNLSSDCFKTHLPWSRLHWSSSSSGAAKNWSHLYSIVDPSTMVQLTILIADWQCLIIWLLITWPTDCPSWMPALFLIDWNPKLWIATWPIDCWLFYFCSIYDCIALELEANCGWKNKFDKFPAVLLQHWFNCG